MGKLAVFMLAAWVGLPLLPTAGQPAEKLVTVCPEVTDELLANPGMGWETFHHPRQQDKSLPAWLPSTIQYARWGWKELESGPGQLNTNFLDNVLKETHDSGQKLAFRVMCCSTTHNEPYHPDWLKKIGGKELQADYGWSTFPIPDMDDPVVLKAHLDFIQRLGARYDGHPDLDHVDLGSIGWWGEWHMSSSKKWQNVGSTPCYKPYRVAVRLTAGGSHQTIMISDIAVNRWLPGSIPLFTKDFFREPQDLPPGEIADVTATLALPHELPAGTYALSLAVVDAEGGQPVVRLGIKSRAEDGWYPLSEEQIVR